MLLSHLVNMQSKYLCNFTTNFFGTLLCALAVALANNVKLFVNVTLVLDYGVSVCVLEKITERCKGTVQHPERALYVLMVHLADCLAFKFFTVARLRLSETAEVSSGLNCSFSCTHFVVYMCNI